MLSSPYKEKEIKFRFIKKPKISFRTFRSSGYYSSFATICSILLDAIFELLALQSVCVSFHSITDTCIAVYV